MGGSAAWENVDSTDAACPSCSNTRAYFMQMVNLSKIMKFQITNYTFKSFSKSALLTSL